MARSAKTAGPGHNSAPLSDEDMAALHHYYTIAIRKDEQVAAQKKADYDAARGEVNKQFALVKGHLGYTRKEFEEVLAAAAKTEEEFLAGELARTKRLSLQGLPVGAQLDMFGKDAADDQGRAHADGFRAGVRADDPVLPSHIATMFANDWMRGWTDGQAQNLSLLTRAEGVLEALKPPEDEDDVGLTDDEPDGDADDEDEDPEAALDADLKRLEESGWAKPTPAEEAVSTH